MRRSLLLLTSVLLVMLIASILAFATPLALPGSSLSGNIEEQHTQCQTVSSSSSPRGDIKDYTDRLEEFFRAVVGTSLPPEVDIVYERTLGAMDLWRCGITDEFEIGFRVEPFLIYFFRLLGRADELGCDALSADRAFTSLDWLLRFYGVEASFDNIECSPSKQLHEGELVTCQWRFYCEERFSEEPCRGAGLMAHVAACSGDVRFVYYRPPIKPSRLPLQEISPEQALELFVQWLQDIRLGGGFAVRPPSNADKIRRVVAFPAHLGAAFQEGLRSVQPLYETARYCWEIPATYEEPNRDPETGERTVNCFAEVYWVDRETGEIIGGSLAPKE